MLLFFLTCTFLVFSQEDPEIEKWMNLELEELGKIKIVSVSVGKKNVSIREAPGIISLITSTEIENSGARDLIDILRLVPGFDFNIDVESAIGVGFRGNWGHEGKILTLVDGQEMNELLYAALPFGNHFPIRQIDRIEIIRGPGSSFYGQFAELSVINIVTKNQPGDKGVTISADFGQMSQTYGRRDINLQLAPKIKNLDLNLGLYWGKGNRGQQPYTDIYGNSYEMKEESGTENLFLDLGLVHKKTSARFILDRYRYDMRDGFDEIYELPMIYAFNSFYAETKTEFRVGHTLKLVPKINYSSQYPWNSTDENSIAQDHFYKVRVDRIKFSMNLSGDITDRIYINGGLIQYFDRGVILGDTPPDSYFNGEKKARYSANALFAQAFMKTPIVVFTAGFRYDHHNKYGESIVPWIGINKVYKKLYFKFLYGQTFRVPSIANITLGKDIKPEKSNEFDLEMGYEIKKSMILSLNFFTTGIKNPIIYNVDPVTDEEYYENFGKTGTWGFEAEYLIKGGWGSVNTNYSFYRAKKDKLDAYIVEDKPGLMLGYPAHKFTLNSSLQVTKQFSVNPSLIYYSTRYGYTSADEEGNLILEKFDPVFLANVFLYYKNVVRGFDIGIGVYDIFGENYRYIQPYAGGHAPYPGTGREIIFKLNYKFK